MVNLADGRTAEVEVVGDFEFELVICGFAGERLDSHRVCVEGYAYKSQATVQVSPNGKILALICDGYFDEETDIHLRILEVIEGGRLRLIHSKDNGRQRHPLEPRVAWTEDDSFAIEWVKY